jgi:hypothetical protein
MSVGSTLAMVDDELRYTGEEGAGWHIPARDVAAVGELTTPAGPAADDYFIIFLRWDGRYEVAPLDAEGRAGALAGLGALLGGELGSGLYDSTSWRSRVIWPPQLAGRPLFDLEDAAACGPGDRIRRWLGWEHKDLTLAPEMRAHIDSR